MLWESGRSAMFDHDLASHSIPMVPLGPDGLNKCLMMETQPHCCRGGSLDCSSCRDPAKFQQSTEDLRHWGQSTLQAGRTVLLARSSEPNARFSLHVAWSPHPQARMRMPSCEKAMNIFIGDVFFSVTMPMGAFSTDLLCDPGTGAQRPSSLESVRDRRWVADVSLVPRE